mmetsp:Transcript_23318/g.43422  ORF Transcript_23318/g.43422 Transcript_23318/m.43422 type:complete len:84 (+) Transcript_23318:374-625(+)
MLLTSGAQVDRRDLSGAAALDIAIEPGRGNAEIVKLLVYHGADLNARDKQFRTPFVRYVPRHNNGCAYQSISSNFFTTRSFAA